MDIVVLYDRGPGRTLSVLECGRWAVFAESSVPSFSVSLARHIWNAIGARSDSFMCELFVLYKRYVVQSGVPGLS